MAQKNRERAEAMPRASTAVNDWEIVDKDIYQFDWPEHSDANSFALFKVRPPQTLLQLFQIFMPDSLLRSVWDIQAEEDDGWMYKGGRSGQRTLQGGRYNAKFVNTYIAMYIWIQGNKRRHDERFYEPRKLRHAFIRASNHLGRDMDPTCFLAPMP